MPVLWQGLVSVNTQVIARHLWHVWLWPSHLSLNLFLDTAHPDKGPLHSMAEGARDDHVGIRDGTRVAPSNGGMETVRKQGGKALRGSHNQMIKEPPPHTHTVGALPITTQGSRYPFSTSPHVHTHDPRLHGSESGGVIPIEEPPPRGDSGLGLGTGQYTQLPCGCPAEPYQSWGRWLTPAGSASILGIPEILPAFSRLPPFHCLPTFE